MHESERPNDWSENSKQHLAIAHRSIHQVEEQLYKVNQSIDSFIHSISSIRGVYGSLNIVLARAKELQKAFDRFALGFEIDGANVREQLVLVNVLHDAQCQSN